MTEPKRTLFIDDGDIVEKRNVDRITHAAEKYGGNPVVSADQPWEDDEVLMAGTVRSDNGRFRMWYQNSANWTNFNCSAAIFSPRQLWTGTVIVDVPYDTA